MPAYCSCDQKFEVPGRPEPRPASRADVASALPATHTPETRHVRIWEQRTRAATKEAAGEAGALHHENTTTHKHTIRHTSETRRAASFTALSLTLTAPLFAGMAVYSKSTAGMVVLLSCMSMSLSKHRR